MGVARSSQEQVLSWSENERSKEWMGVLDLAARNYLISNKGRMEKP